MTMKDFIECAVDLRCTVLTKDNQFLFVGRITHYDPETDMIRLVDYERRQILRNSAPEGSVVKLFIRLTQNKGELILIEGKVVKSMSLFLMIQAVQAVIKEEARDNYRQNIMRPAALSKVNEEPREVPCTILNVSATGIALQSPGLVPDRRHSGADPAAVPGAWAGAYCQMQGGADARPGRGRILLWLSVRGADPGGREPAVSGHVCLAGRRDV